MSKENQKTTSDFDALDPTGCGTQRPLRALGGTRVLLTAAQQLLPVSAAGGGRRRCKKGAARPFQTPKGKSKWKNASRFAKRIFLTSPIYGFAEGVTSLLTVKFCESLKSSAKP